MHRLITLRPNDLSLRYALPALLIMALLIITLLCPASAGAAPAPWYLWQSKLNGQTICLQHFPGPGWHRLQGPFKQDNCRP